MALVKSLRERGIPIRDIAVVVRDLDTYEKSLCRAALQYGIAPVCWTQLRVTRTRPYALVESICEVLAAGEVDSNSLLRPLDHRWAPPDADTDGWPVEPKTVQQAKSTLSKGPRALEEWVKTVETSDDIPDAMETASEVAGVSYSVHNAGSEAFVRSLVADRGGRVTHAFAADLSVERQFDFHREARKDLPVEVYRIEWGHS